MFVLSLLAIFPAFSLAQVVPTAPGPGQVYPTGSQCSIQWQPDTTGIWKAFSIDLMSGSNTNMSLVTNVVSGLDGTASSSYNWTCPQVTPNAAIYFYQFTPNGTTTSSPSWTTRFTISSSSGATTPPKEPTQPNGQPIPWGVGNLSSVGAEEVTPLKSPTNTNLPMTTSPNDVATTASSTSLATTLPSPPLGLEDTGGASSASPEVTMNVPMMPINRRNARRGGFATVYARQPSKTDAPRHPPVLVVT